MSKYKLTSAALLLVATICSAQLGAQSQTTDDASTAASLQAKPTMLLQGSVKHKERLEPVAPSLMQGAVFDEQSLPKLTPNNNWIPIPPWMAGTWQFKTENVTGMVNYTKEDYTPPPYTIKNETQKIFGHQKDKSGQIWHYLKSPYSYTTKLGHGVIGYERVTSSEPITMSEQQIVLRIVGTDTQVKPKGNKVLITDQAEDFNHYSPLGKDRLLVGGSAKHFDMNGQPTMDMVSNMIAQQAKGYEEIDEQDGENLKQNFADFLKSHGKADLVP